MSDSQKIWLERLNGCGYLAQVAYGFEEAKLTKIIADCIYTGVSTDTGCFRFSNTTVRTFEIASKLADVAVITSDNPRSEDPDAIIADITKGVSKHGAKVIVEPDRTKAIAKALSTAKAGDVVILAGKGQETYQILASGKIHFDEREVVAKILSEKAAK